MYPTKLLVIDNTPPSEGGFFGCMVVRHLKELPKALEDPASLVFLFLDPGVSVQEAPSSELLEEAIPSRTLDTRDRRICVLVKTRLLALGSSPVAAVLQYIQTLVGPFHLSMAVTLSREDADRASANFQVPENDNSSSIPLDVPLQATDFPFTILNLPAEPDKALGTLLSLSADNRYLLKATPEKLHSFLRLVPMLSELGKRFLFWGEDHFLRELHHTLSPSLESNPSQRNQNPLAPWSKKGSRGLIVVEGPFEGWDAEKEMVKWIDPPSTDGLHTGEASIDYRLALESFYSNLQQALQEGKTACIPTLPKDSPLFQYDPLMETIGRYVQFILFWGKQWDERAVSRLLNLSSYHLLGPVGKGKGLIMGIPIDPSISTLPLILAHEEVGLSLPELYRKLSPPLRTRPSWDDYFLGIARAVAERATCDRGRSGCVIVRDKTILVTGYVGSPTGLPHCDEVGHQMKKMLHEDGRITQHCVRTVHAEQNAICQAAKYGISLNGGTLYCKMTPCRTCAMLIINCGIRRVVCEYRYHAGGESEELFRLAGIALEFKHPEILPYTDQ